MWEAGGPGFVRFSAQFDSSSEKAGELGRIVEDVNIQRALHTCLNELSIKSSENGGKLDIVFGASISAFAIGDSGTSPSPGSVSRIGRPPATLEVTNQKTGVKKNIRTSLLVGADGSGSVVRRLAGIPTWGWTYGQEAVVATVKLAAPSYGSAVNNGQQTTLYQTYTNSAIIPILALH